MRKGKKTYIKAAFLVFLIIGTIFIIKQQRDMPYQHNEGFIFGTVYHATYQYDKDLNEEIVAELNKVDVTFSMFNKQSTVSAFNRGKRIEADRMFMEVLTLSQTINRETGGAFDITVAPLVNAWGFGFKHQQMPTPQQVDSLRKLVGMHYININNVGKKTIVSTNHKNLMLDFSAIAKGYGSDMVAKVMRRHDIKNYMIEIGGEIVTSGLSEGKKFAHTIDPRTGYPVQHSLLSSTVLANSCAEADGYATAFMVLGVERAKAVLAQHPELMAYFIYADKDGKMNVWYSSSLKKKVEK